MSSMLVVAQPFHSSACIHLLWFSTSLVSSSLGRREGLCYYVSVPDRFAAPRVAAITVVALELIAVELVDYVPLYSRAFSRVTLGLVNGMMETSLPSPSCQNGESTAVHRAPPHGHTHGPSSSSHHQNPSHLG